MSAGNGGTFGLGMAMVLFAAACGVAAVLAVVIAALRHRGEVMAVAEGDEGEPPSR